jgi:hypothetical protein
VGAHNTRFFLQFLLYTFLGSVYALVLAVTRFVGCWRGWWGPAAELARAAAGRAFNAAGSGPIRGPVRFPHSFGAGGGGGGAGVSWLAWSSWGAAPGPCTVPGTSDVILIVVSCVLALFFAIFTAAMAWDQWEGWATNTTAVESMKGWEEEERGFVEGLSDYCGCVHVHTFTHTDAAGAGPGRADWRRRRKG